MDISYEKLLEKYRESNDEEKREILQSGIEVLDFLEEMDSPEIVKALTLVKNRDEILTELGEASEKHSELLLKINDKDIKNQIEDLKKFKLSNVINRQAGIETKETAKFLEEIEDLADQEREKSNIDRQSDFEEGRNSLGEQEVNPNITSEEYDKGGMYSTFGEGEPPKEPSGGVKETIAELNANDTRNRDIFKINGKGGPFKVSREKLEEQQKGKDGLEGPVR